MISSMVRLGTGPNDVIRGYGPRSRFGLAALGHGGFFISEASE